jgi:hypothetical protein
MDRIDKFFTDHWIIILATILIIGFARGFNKVEWSIENWLTGNLLASLCIIWILDLVRQIRENNRNKRLKKLWLKRLKVVYGQNIGMLNQLYTFAIKWSTISSEPIEFFRSQSVLELLEWIDLLVEVPKLPHWPKKTWWEKLIIFSERIDDNIDKILSRYVQSLPEEIVEICEWFTDQRIHWISRDKEWLVEAIAIRSKESGKATIKESQLNVADRVSSVHKIKIALQKEWYQIN